MRTGSAPRTCTPGSFLGVISLSMISSALPSPPLELLARLVTGNNRHKHNDGRGVFAEMPATAPPLLCTETFHLCFGMVPGMHFLK